MIQLSTKAIFTYGQQRMSEKSGLTFQEDSLCDMFLEVEIFWSSTCLSYTQKPGDNAKSILWNGDMCSSVMIYGFWMYIQSLQVTSKQHPCQKTTLVIQYVEHISLTYICSQNFGNIGGICGIILPNNTSTCRMKKLGIKLQTLWLVNDHLYVLSHSHSNRAKLF